MYNHILYLSYWVVNAVCLYLASRLLPSSFVLGTWRFTPCEAAIYSGFWLTFFIWTMWDFIFVRGVKMRGGLEIFLYFWVVNSLGIWLIARVSHFTGMGISAYYWALVLGFIVDIAQRVTRNIIVSPKGR